MASRSRFCTAHPATILLCFLPSLLSGGLQAHSRVEELTLYVHEDRVPGPTATLITVTAPSGNLSQVGFGTIQAFSNILRDGAQNSSEVIGVEPGFVTIGTQNVFISYVLSLTTETYNGTLSVQGQFGFNVWPRELAVIGGTGSFRFANGYDTSYIVDESNLADYVTVHYIYLKYV